MGFGSRARRRMHELVRAEITSTRWTSPERREVRPAPGEKLSSTRTSSPRSSSARTTFEPMKPPHPPPVTSALHRGRSPAGGKIPSGRGFAHDRPEHRRRRSPGYPICSRRRSAAAAASLRRRHARPAAGCPATIPSGGPLAASGEERAQRYEAAPAAQGVGARAAARHASCEPRGADEQEQRESDHAGVGEHLDVEVLDAPQRSSRREREVDVREAAARVVDVRLEDLRPRRALPADAHDRVVLEDPQPDVGEHRALRVRLHADGGSSPERRGSAGSPRARRREPLSPLPATTATTATSARAAGPGRKRRVVRRRERTATPTARPPAAATEPARTRPRTPPRARHEERRRGVDASWRRSRPRPARGERESAARSWCPRNEGWRQPAFQASKTSTRRTGAARPRSRPPAPEDERAEEDREVLAAAHEQRTATARSPYSQSFTKVTRWSRRAVVVDRGAAALEREPQQERRAEDPEPARPGAGRGRVARRRRPRRRRRGARRDRRADVDGRRADVDADVLGLEALVEEEEGDRAPRTTAPRRRGRELGRADQDGGASSAYATRRTIGPPSHPAGGRKPSEALPTLSRSMSSRVSGAGRRRPRGSTPRSRSGSSARSSPRASSASTSSACSRPRSPRSGSSRRSSTSRSRSRSRSTASGTWRTGIGAGFGASSGRCSSQGRRRRARDGAPRRARAVRGRDLRRATASAALSRRLCSPSSRRPRTSARPRCSCTAATTSAASTRRARRAPAHRDRDRRPVRRHRGAARDRGRPGDRPRASRLVGFVALRRFPHAPPRPLGEDVPGIRSFVLQSSLATGVISLRTTLVPVILGVVAGPTQVGLFRIAQTPQTGLAAASSPARLVLLTEQTRDWERGGRPACSTGSASTRSAPRR